MAITYPSEFPCPEIGSYVYEVAMGQLTGQQRGHSVTRKQWDHMPHLVRATYVLEDKQLGIWQQWMETNGINWFNIPLVTMYNKPLNDGRAPMHVARVISDISIQAINENWFRANVEFELSPSMWLKGV